MSQLRLLMRGGLDEGKHQEDRERHGEEGGGSGSAYQSKDRLRNLRGSHARQIQAKL